MGREPPRPHRDHQGHAGVQPGEVGLGRAFPLGRHADVRTRGAAAVRYVRRGHHHHWEHGAAVLLVRLQPAAAHREPVCHQATRQPQRGNRARHCAEREGGGNVARVHLPVRAHAAQPDAIRRGGGRAGERRRPQRPPRRPRAHRRRHAREEWPRQVRPQGRGAAGDGPGAHRVALLRVARHHLHLQRAPQAYHGRDRALPPLLAIGRVQVSGRAAGGEGGAGQAAGARAHPREGVSRGALGQGKRAAAVVHLQPEAGRAGAAVGHGVRHAERGPPHAGAVRDRAQARVGAAGGQGARPLQDDQQAHVGEPDPAPPVQGHSRRDPAEGREERPAVGALLRPVLAGDWRAHPLP
mmetsp:Transcript_42551/g.71009  ORF Transcript_42551/g.71009 Transcript_42551/m.71009 type:complete len:353 (+) Transcript_42551:2735-3793(+)